jgi:hypothetical protein
VNFVEVRIDVTWREQRCRFGMIEFIINHVLK